MPLPLPPEKLKTAPNWLAHFHPCLFQFTFQEYCLVIPPFLSYSLPPQTSLMGCSQHCSPWNSRPFIFDPSLLLWLMSYLSFMLPLVPLPCTLQSSHKRYCPLYFFAHTAWNCLLASHLESLDATSSWKSFLISPRKMTLFLFWALIAHFTCP